MTTKPVNSTISTQDSLVYEDSQYTYAIQTLGKRWTWQILYSLRYRPCRFTELTRQIGGLSDHLLASRLRDLEREGIVKRIVFTQKPVLIEYQLTDKGRALDPVIDALQRWAEDWVSLSAPL
jgi:DNA-binding HxlR family transcriptional regulator